MWAFVARPLAESREIAKHARVRTRASLREVSNLEGVDRTRMGPRGHDPLRRAR